MKSALQHIILDAPFAEEKIIQPSDLFKLEKEELIVWKGQPASLRELNKMEKTNRSITNGASNLGIFSILGCFLIAAVILIDYSIILSLLIVLWTIIMLVIAYFNKIPKDLKTTYFVTSQRIVFLKSKSIKSFDLDQISSMRTFRNIDYKNLGKLYFKIKNRSFQNSPYFENIKNIDELHQLIEQTISKNKKK